MGSMPPATNFLVQIRQVDVDSFLDDSPLPCCEVTVVAKAGEGTAEHFHYLVPILNINPSQKVSIQCSLLIPASKQLGEQLTNKFDVFSAFDRKDRLRIE